MNTRLLLGVAAAGLVVAYVLTQRTEAGPAPLYRATFTVTDEQTATPLVGATIKMAGVTVFTNGTGVAIIDLPSTGGYEFQVEFLGYDPYSGSFTVS